MLNRNQLIAVYSGASFVGGVAVGYILASKSKAFTEKNEETLSQESDISLVPKPEEEKIELALSIPETFAVTDEGEIVYLGNSPSKEEVMNFFDSPENSDDQDEQDDEQDDEQGDEQDDERDDVNLVTVNDKSLNVFDEDAGSFEGWNHALESANRSLDEPYIITETEYFGSETGYDKASLVYYAKDEQLINEDDTPIYDKSNVVCDLKFGHGSNDPEIVYVRNDRLKKEFQIFRSDASYAEENLGLFIDEVSDHIKIKDLTDMDDPED